MANLLLCYCTMCGKDGKLVSKRQRRQHYDEHDPHLDAPTRVISAVMREQTKKLKTRQQTESATRAETESATRAVTLDDDSDQSAGPLHSSPYEQDVHNDNAFDGGLNTVARNLTQLYSCIETHIGKAGLLGGVNLLLLCRLGKPRLGAVCVY